MEHIEIDDPLPAPIAKLLITLVDVAERNQVMDVLCIESTSGEAAYDLEIVDGTSKGTRVPCKGDYLGTLEMVGLVQQALPSVFLRPAAFKRARYERSNRLSKWVARTVHKWRDYMVVISFVISVVVGILTILARINPPHP